ncbi:Holliday junction branch migration protein RuvA [Mariniblastus fucicola]|uniref:Holliday junction branch migration complex subunit RuvA n=1 Tax=Mariniblastus fucicola TaxID=980251 RepID=A0A5B9PCH5_9BACT|nr:Holliday junction branch migration protein RuvA [Mariniblastus fucicola]QEG23954.1 Holliday junction ATP-dependent DNA helicase RuvA [Mariniblastus fucicola]
MIRKITGLLCALPDDCAVLEVPPFEYEVLVPEFTRRQIQMKLGEQITLHTIQYIDGNVQKGGRMTPRLIGFNSVAEKQFFEVFCSVDGLGVKKALKAMVRPVPDVARSIEQQDVKTLTTMPGIGAATAERIVAKLRRKMARFALLVPAAEGDQGSGTAPSIAEEVYQILVSFGHSEQESRKMVDDVLVEKKKFKDVDAFLSVVYEKKNAE